MRKQDGFQAMELELADDSPSRRRRRRRSRRRTGKEFSKWAIGSFLAVSIALVIVVASLLTSEEHKLGGTGLWPGNNPDELSSKPDNQNASFSHLIPPQAHRDVVRFAQIGIAPPNWDPQFPRQSQESDSALLDPPRLVPDPYGWLRDDDRSNPEILAYLQAENNYTQERLQTPLAPLQETLYQELLHYMEETSHSFPARDRNFYYYRRTLEGQAYPIHCRAPVSTDEAFEYSGAYLQKHLEAWNKEADAPILPGEDIYLDENVQAEEHEFFALGELAVSPSETLLAYTVDTAGNELYNWRIENIQIGERISIGDTNDIVDDIVWGQDDNTLFVSKPDHTQRPYIVFRRDTNPSGETVESLLYEEFDVTYWVGFDVSMDLRFLLVETASTESSEIYYLDLQDDSNATLKCISKRRPQVLYSAEHVRGYWWVLSNVNDPDGDFQFFTVPVGAEYDDQWTRVMEPTDPQGPLLDDIAITDFTVFRHHIVITGRHEGILGLWIVQLDEGDASKVLHVERVEFTEEQAHTASLGANVDYETQRVMVEYMSMVTPRQQIEVSLERPNDERLVVYEAPVPAYDKSSYTCQRIHVMSRDGTTEIPVSMVYRTTVGNGQSFPQRSTPIHLYGYGAYGVSIDDTFSTSRLPLLDRDIIFAVAHVRGGGEMGRQWYADGKLFNKHKTFDDFIDVGRYFVRKGWTTPDLLSCEGRSAGGLTIGASLNQAPDLFRAAILGVPFVDLVVTMMDASIPLTTSEWREWGNPNEEDYFEAMMGYSPMNNVQNTTYPSMLLLAGLFDPRVAYWEPAKLTATFRYTAISRDDRPICLKTDMNSGHFSASDRYKHLKERSFEYAFIFDQLGII